MAATLSRRKEANKPKTNKTIPAEWDVLGKQRWRSGPVSGRMKKPSLHGPAVIREEIRNPRFSQSTHTELWTVFTWRLSYLAASWETSFRHNSTPAAVVPLSGLRLDGLSAARPMLLGGWKWGDSCWERLQAHGRRWRAGYGWFFSCCDLVTSEILKKGDTLCCSIFYIGICKCWAIRYLPAATWKLLGMFCVCVFCISVSAQSLCSCLYYQTTFFLLLLLYCKIQTDVEVVWPWWRNTVYWEPLKFLMNCRKKSCFTDVFTPFTSSSLSLCFLRQVSICLECNSSKLRGLKRKWIRCSAQATVLHLKKFIAKKLNLTSFNEVQIMMRSSSPESCVLRGNHCCICRKLNVVFSKRYRKLWSTKIWKRRKRNTGHSSSWRWEKI